MKLGIVIVNEIYYWPRQDADFKNFVNLTKLRENGNRMQNLFETHLGITDTYYRMNAKIEDF